MDDVEYVIEHYGKKGMKWGTRRSSTTGVRPLAKTLNNSKIGRASNANAQRSMSRSANRAKNKKSRAKDRKTFDKSIDKSRQNVKSGKVKRDYNKVKQAHTANKAKLGSREARKILNEAKNKRYNELNTAQQVKTGKETAAYLAGAAIFLASYAALRVALRPR